MMFRIPKRRSQTGCLAVLAGVLTLFSTGYLPSQACTIFVLTDREHALFFNNEDYSNPSTRLWFIPAGEGFLGCAFVGFDDGWAQGGVNTAGLAYDWVAGVMEKWQPDAALKQVRGNPSQRMLESCTTVDEAIAFYQKTAETSFDRSRILIADRSGASVIIGAKDNRLFFERSTVSRGFGYDGEKLDRALAKSPAALVSQGLPILSKCAQRGRYATKYSTIYDLRNADIQVFPSFKNHDGLKLALNEELAKGAHYYDIPELKSQMKRPPKALRNEMKRFYLDEFSAVADGTPEVTGKIRKMILESAAGNSREEDYTPEFWAAIAAERENIKTSLKQMGDMVSLSLVGSESTRREYRYKVEFQKMTVLQRFVFDAQGRVRLIQSEANELKPGARLADR